MATRTVLQSFNAGQLSPLIEPRSDMEKYRSGCRQLENMIPRVYGSAERRPGFEYIASSYGAATTVRMVPFIYNAEISYECEFGDSYIRFYYDGDLLEDEGGNQVVITTPYAAADLFDLQFEQVGDVMWIVHPRYQQRKLTRTSAYSFSLDTITFRQGPFLLRNDLIDPYADNTAAMSCDVQGVGLSGTLTCDTDYFFEDHVGALFKLWHPRSTKLVSLSGSGSTSAIRGKGSYSLITRGTWTGSLILQRKESSAGWEEFRQWKSSTSAYQNVIFSFEEEVDDNVQYRLYSADANAALRAELSIDEALESGTVRVTAFTDAKNVTVTVLSEIGSTDSTKRFAEGAWSDLRGYPGTVAFFEDRCCYAGTVLDTDAIVTASSGSYTPIRSIQDLKDIADDLSGDYELLVDLDLSSETNWTPVGASGTEFTGTFNGRGHTISNLTISDPVDGEYLGLFGAASGATLENLFIETATIQGFRRMGALCGQVAGVSTITNCHVDGVTIQGRTADDSFQYVGGLIGEAYGTVANCDVQNTDLTFDTATSCGGLLGFLNGTATDCYARGECTAVGSFTTINSFGGLIGNLANDSTITTCYASHEIPTGSSNSKRGGLIGNQGTGETYTNNYFNSDEHANGVEDGNEAGVTAKTSAQLKNETTYTGFDFDNDWGIDEGNDYAYLLGVKAVSFVQLAGESTIWLSETGDYENFDEGVNDADSFSLTILSTDRIYWLAAMDNLLAGTAGAEFVIRSNRLETPISPTNFTVKRQTTYGSKYLQALPVDQSVLFVDCVGRKVRELTFTVDKDKFVAPDLTVLAEDITDSGIVCIAHQKNPDSILWCVLDDGSLISMVYDREQNVVAWSDHPIDGTVQSVCVAQAADEDEVWISVTRTINSSDVVYIEKMGSRTFSTATNAFFVDSGVTFTPQLLTLDSAPAPAAWSVGATITGNTSGTTAKITNVLTTTTYEIGSLTGDFTDGEVITDGTNSRDCGAGYPTVAATTSTVIGDMDHLVGETVTVLGDGTVYAPTAVVDSNGLATISTAVSTAQAGLAYEYALQPMRIVLNTPIGTSTGANTRVKELVVSFMSTSGVDYAANQTATTNSINFDDERWTNSSAISGLFTGEVVVNVQGGFDPLNPIVISGSDPLPCTIRSLVASVEVTGR